MTFANGLGYNTSHWTVIVVVCMAYVLVSGQVAVERIVMARDYLYSFTCRRFFLFVHTHVKVTRKSGVARAP